MVVVKVNGVQCRTIMGTGAGSTYIDEALANELKRFPVDVYKIEMCKIACTCSLQTEVCKAGKSVLLTLSKPILLKYHQ